MSTNRPFRLSAGFTLIELLVVISIIALLIALLLPALGKAKLAANNTLGSTDLNSIGKALYIYAADYNQWTPTTHPMLAGNYVQLDPGAAFYQQRSNGGWTIWDVGQTFVTGGFVDGRGPVGLGVLVSTQQSVGTNATHAAKTGYITDGKVFFHPVMRDIAAANGTSRHWFNFLKNWGMYQGDPNIYVGATPLSASNSWSASGNFVGGDLINSTVMWRGGDWTPIGDGTDYYTPGTYGGKQGYDAYNQLKLDAIGFSKRVLLSGNLFENQAARQGGQINFMTGDCAVGVSKQPEFIGSNGAPGTQCSLVTLMQLGTDPQYRHPTTGVNSAGVGQLAAAVAYLIEKRDLQIIP